MEIPLNEFRGTDSADPFRERVADAIVHGVGLIAAFLGVGQMMIMTTDGGDTVAFATAAVFCAGLLISMALSAAFHLVDARDGKTVLRRANLAGVYLLIVGACTPLAAIAIGDQAGWSLLGFLWLIAVAGVILNLALPDRYQRASVVLYLLIGWALIGSADSFATNMSSEGLRYLVYCWILFSTGLIFARWDSLPFQYAIWRCFTLAAIGCLYAAIYVELSSL